METQTISVLVLMAFVVSPVQAELYRCVDVEGKQTISDSPCPNGPLNVRRTAVEQSQGQIHALSSALSQKTILPLRLHHHCGI